MEDFEYGLKSQWGEHVDRTLEKLFYNKKFIQEIESFRLKIGMPVQGYEEIDDFWKFVKKNAGAKKIIQDKSLKMARERRLPDIYSVWVEAFIGVDFKCVEYINPFLDSIFPGHGYAFETFNKEYFVFRVYPGASQTGFIEFVKKYWFLVKDVPVMDEKAKLTFPKVRKDKFDRNAQILRLYEEKKITALGEWKPTNKEPRPKILNGLVTDNIKKIITYEKRKKKFYYRYKNTK